MGTTEQIDQRCRLNASTKREIVAALQNLFDQQDELVRLFRTESECQLMISHFNHFGNHTITK